MSDLTKKLDAVLRKRKPTLLCRRAHGNGDKMQKQVAIGFLPESPMSFRMQAARLRHHANNNPQRDANLLLHAEALEHVADVLGAIPEHLRGCTANDMAKHHMSQ